MKSTTLLAAVCLGPKIHLLKDKYYNIKFSLNGTVFRPGRFKFKQLKMDFKIVLQNTFFGYLFKIQYSV